MNKHATGIALRFILLSSLFSSCSLADNQPSFSFSKQEENLTKIIIQHLNDEHYQAQDINDEFSSNLFDAYLLTLDPQKIYFTQQDIKRLKDYRLQLDDHINANNHTAIIDMYNTFYAQYSHELKDTIKHFDRYSKGFQSPSDKLLNIDIDNIDWPKDKEASHQRWLNFVHNDFINLKLADKSNTEAKDILIKRYQTRLDRTSKLDSTNVYETFINTLTSLYDPHTNWLSPKALENFRINMSLSLEGIGAVLQKDGEYTKIVRLITAGPAAKQGELIAGNKIIAVGQGGSSKDMQDIVGWRLDEVVQLIRGDAGSQVTLQVQDDKEKLKYITIEREKVKLEDQAAKKTIITIPNHDGSKDDGSNKETLKIGVINIPAFYMDFEAYRRGDDDFRSTTRDVYNLIRELDQENIDGLVIDLRNNGGGSLREATTLTDLFIDRGPVVQIRSADNQVSRRYRSQSKPLYDGPLLVFINHFSASASEIFAGAIQDYQRGLIVGEQSFGKGTVQTLSELSSGQLKLTTAKFYRVSGDSTQHRGIVPDISYPSLFDFDEVGESALDHALIWDQIHNVDHQSYDRPNDLLNELTQAHDQRMQNSPDFQFLTDRIDYIAEQKENTALVLDYQKRAAKTEASDNAILDMVNNKRRGKKQEPFDNFDDYKTHQDDLNAKRSGSSEITIDDDFLLQESATILVDIIRSNTEKEKVAEVD